MGGDTFLRSEIDGLRGEAPGGASPSEAPSFLPVKGDRERQKEIAALQRCVEVTAGFSLSHNTDNRDAILTCAHVGVEERLLLQQNRRL